MNLIRATLSANADGTLHLPLPPELRHGKLNVVASVEPAPTELSSAAEPDSNSSPAVVRRHAVTQFPVIECQLKGDRGEEVTPDRAAALLLEQEIKWQHEAD